MKNIKGSGRNFNILNELTKREYRKGRLWSWSENNRTTGGKGRRDFAHRQIERKIKGRDTGDNS